MPVGEPQDHATQIGPIASARQRVVVENYIEIGRTQGAKLVVGGGRPQGLDRGWFVEPTIFTDVEPDMRIAQEEIVGPVLAVITYEDEDQAVAFANNSWYGLSGSVFTSHLEHGVALARRMRTGTVEQNGTQTGFHPRQGALGTAGSGEKTDRRASPPMWS